MFNIDTSKKPLPIKKAIIVKTNRNKINLSHTSNDIVEVTPKVTNSTTEVVTCADIDEVQSNTILFEIY